MLNVFSPDERAILKTLGRRKMTITQLTEKHFARATHPPVYPNNYIGGVVRRIARKCEYYKLGWTLAGERTHDGRRVWRAKR